MPTRSHPAQSKPHTFKARLALIGINPFVFVPARVLKSIFLQAGKDKGPIPVCGTLNGAPYRQTLVRYGGDWRLYVNTVMLKNSPQKLGETVQVTIQFDPELRTVAPHPKWVTALNRHPKAKQVFESLPPSRRKEIVRYISGLKTEASVERNIKRAVAFLLGKGTFVGRAKP